MIRLSVIRPSITALSLIFPCRLTTIIHNLKSSLSTTRMSTHPDFKTVEASRPAWSKDSTFHYTQTADSTWTFGAGPNTIPTTIIPHVSIDPCAPGRPAGFNYKLLISAVTPRPIAFVSTMSKDGARNLAPFSYFNMMCHDPPMFAIGFSRGLTEAKDTLRNLVETGKCVINIISEDFVEAANATCVNAPYGISEWDIAGLTGETGTVNGVPRVGEAIVSIEGELVSTTEFDSVANPGTKSGVMALVKGTRFWVREDAINDNRSIVDTKVLRPVSRLGGISYGRTTEAFEILRIDFDKDIGGLEGFQTLKK